MRTRQTATFLTAALAVWVAGSALGTPSAPTAHAMPLLQVGRAHPASHLPPLDADEPVFFLVLGSDARPGQRVDRLRSDAIHLIGVNPGRHTASILNFPRDSFVPIPGHGSDKLTSAMTLGGPELTVQTVEQLTGIQIDYYLLTSFQGVEAMVDDIGGIAVDVRYPMHDTPSGSNFEPGVQELDGAEALAFSRDRHSTPGGDFGRTENQGRLLLAALREFRQEFTENPGRLLVWMGAGMRNVQTDLPIEQILDFFFFVATVNPSGVKSVTLQGGVGFAGDKSVVFISDSANALYADMRQDGVLNG
jgi:polyisoprenyl-teichoic acid--peptidoglycan teichoic acid transferase